MKKAQPSLYTGVVNLLLIAKASHLKVLLNGKGIKKFSYKDQQFTIIIPAKKNPQVTILFVEKRF